VQKSKAVPLLRFATQKKERPTGGPAAHTLEGAAPLQTSQLPKGAPLRGEPASFARIQREGASAPPAPTPRKYKSKSCLSKVGVGLAFEPEIRAVLDRAERPQGRTDEPPVWLRPTPIRSGVCTAVVPRVINPAFFALPTGSVGPGKVELWLFLPIPSKRFNWPHYGPSSSVSVIERRQKSSF
jgi:hypothetical protein